ncbi:MAG: thioredoxin family protein [Chthoniobacterales bacterium]
MNKARALFFASAILLGVATSAQAAGEWLTDFKKAQQEAKASSKLLLINFTGSDWCGFCILLDRQVFSKAEFKDYASKNLVLLEADFPRMGGPRWKEQSDAIRTQNEELAKKYQIFGFPTIVVLNGDGKIVGELGYMQGGPEEFIAELDKLRKG